MKVFRLRLVKLLLLGFLLANLVFLYYTWNTLLWRRISRALSGESQPAEEPPKAAKLSPKEKLRNANKHIRKSITIVFYGHYNFEQDLKASIDSILDVIPNMPILVLQDGGAEYAYPPVNYERNLTAGEERTVLFQSLSFDVRRTRQELNPLASIRTKYALIMPDGVRLNSKNILQKILREINSMGLPGQPKEQRPPVPPEQLVRRMVLVPFAGNLKSFSSCVKMNLDLPDWTLELVATNDTRRCDLVGKNQGYGL